MSNTAIEFSQLLKTELESIIINVPIVVTYVPRYDLVKDSNQRKILIVPTEMNPQRENRSSTFLYDTYIDFGVYGPAGNNDEYVQQIIEIADTIEQTLREYEIPPIEIDRVFYVADHLRQKNVVTSYLRGHWILQND